MTNLTIRGQAHFAELPEEVKKVVVFDTEEGPNTYKKNTTGMFIGHEDQKPTTIFGVGSYNSKHYKER